MISEVRKYWRATPFIPFAIHLSDGREFKVPTFEHMAIHPKGNRAIVFADDGTHDVLSGLHISGVKAAREPANMD